MFVGFQMPIVSTPSARRTGSSTSARIWKGSPIVTGWSPRESAFRTR